MRTALFVLAAHVSFLTGRLVAGENPAAEAETAEFKREYGDVLALEGTAKREVLAIAHLLRGNPDMAIDHTADAGEYCFKSGPAMVHIAAHPEGTPEDVVYEFDASGLIAAGLDPTRLKLLPELGQMTPGVWYFLPERQPDPHHGHPMAGPTIAIAFNVR